MSTSQMYGARLEQVMNLAQWSQRTAVWVKVGCFDNAPSSATHQLSEGRGADRFHGKAGKRRRRDTTCSRTLGSYLGVISITKLPLRGYRFQMLVLRATQISAAIVI